MAGIDAILRIMVDRDATELRLPSDRAPSMSRLGEPLKLTFPPMSAETLRGLAGPLLSDARLAQAEAEGELLLAYASPYLGELSLTVSVDGDALSLVFHRGEELREVEGAPPRPEATGGVAGEFLEDWRAIERLEEERRAEEDWRAEDQPAERRVTPAADLSVSPTAAASSTGSPPPDSSPSEPHSGAPPARSLRPAATPRQRPSAPSPELLGLLQRAAAMGASDLHLAEGEPAVVRVEGRLRALSGPTPSAPLTLLDHALSSAALESLRDHGAADLAVALPDGSRVRANVYRFEAGVAAALRLLRRSPPALSTLGLPEQATALAQLPRGLILVCGPTGSGKSTTLASLAEAALALRGGLLVTLEDPVEYLIQPPSAGCLVRQRELGRDLPDFAAGLRAALREDPDLLLIGEMRDTESITLTLTAAETGHLVLASLHSASAPSAIERICDAFPPGRQQQIRVQLADCLQGVIAQRLLPRLHGGRRLAVEVLRAEHATRKLIRDGRTEQLLSNMQGGGDRGQLPLERHLAELVGRREISLADAREAANQPESLETYLGGLG